jgi:hypothetical protein
MNIFRNWQEMSHSNSQPHDWAAYLNPYTWDDSLKSRLDFWANNIVTGTCIQTLADNY